MSNWRDVDLRISELRENWRYVVDLNRDRAARGLDSGAPGVF